MLDLSHAENQIQCVKTIQDLITNPFQGTINAICWERELQGDFSEIVDKIELNGNMMEVSQAELLALELTEAGKRARDFIMNDLHFLKEQGASPILNIINYYERDDAFPFFPTDVYSYHVDRSPIATDTYLCTYFGASSDILPNSQGVQKILIPEIRAELKKLHDGPDETFESFLSEFFFDLHYQAIPHANPVNLGLGHLWKLAIDHPESQVAPCLHRAPKEIDGEKRLMLIC